MTIRRATLEAVRALTAFGRRVFAVTFGADNTPGDLQSYLDGSYAESLQREEVADRRVETQLAEIDGTLAAFAQLRQGPAGEGVTGAKPIELWRFYVDRAWHGRGVAQAMMDRVKAEAVARGARTLWLGVWEKNDRARAFYAKCGFTDAGEHIFLFGTDPQTDLVMVAPLPDRL